MQNFTARVAGIATLALAALPLAALTTAAHAQPQLARIHVSDLNLASPSDRTVFHQRLEHAARQVCDQESLNIKTACEAGVRAEVNEKLSVRYASR